MNSSEPSEQSGASAGDVIAAAQALGAALASDSNVLSAIAGAVTVRQAADAVLPHIVDDARAHGHTWQEIGDILGISRQAAFQRFGHPTDPRTGKPMNTSPLPGAEKRAAAVFEQLRHGEWHDVYENFDDRMREKMPGEAELGTVWAQITATVGEFESAGTPSVRRAADYTIADVPLKFEAGDMTGRVTFNDAGRISGFFILTPEQAEGF